MGLCKLSRKTWIGTGVLDVRIKEFAIFFLYKLVICTILAASSNVESVNVDDSIVTSIDLGEDFQIKPRVFLCPPNQFSCKDQLKCIEKFQVCDHSIDCYDASDEESCPQLPCRNGTFQCKYSKKCIPNGWLCDRSVDCGFIQGSIEPDMSDEQDPGCKAENQCQPNFFKCSDGSTCIKIAELCDNSAQCPGKEDEHKFCGTTKICREAACRYGCKPSPIGEPICYCSTGKEYDGKDCIESNECSVSGACDQICKLDSNKSKKCECVSGYQQSGSNCKAVNDQGVALLLYQDASDIKWTNLDGTDVSTHSPYQSPPHVSLLGMDFDHLNNTVCWINHHNRSHTMRCAISNKLNQFWNKPNAYLYTFEDVYQINFDWISSNYYFVDEGHEMIFMCQEDLSLCKTIIDTDISKPRGMALDPTEGFIFFTVWGRSGPKLERALMDGSHRENLVTKKIVYPYGITVDLPLKKIYWVDKFLDSIERIDYDGKNRRTIHRGIQLLQDITVFENSLYLTSVHEDSILVLNKFNSTANYTTLKTQLKKPFAIRVYHRVRQPREKHPCNSHNHCKEFCFPLWKKSKPVAKCGCKEGFTLDHDGISCKAEEMINFLIYTRAKTGVIRSISLNTQQTEKLDVMIPVVEKQSHSALAFDAQDSTIYYSDTTNFRIMQKKIGQVESKLYLDKDIGQVESIAVDWIGRNMYWIDETVKAIYVATLKNASTKSLLVHSNLTQPKSIALHPTAGLLFWSNWATSIGKDGSIEQAWMDGTHRTLLVQNLGWPIGLTLDLDNRYLYWLDALQFTIQRIKIGMDDSQTPKREILLKANSTSMGEPSDFTYFNGSFYVAVHGKLLKANVSPQGMSEMEENRQLQSFLENQDDVLRILAFDPSRQRGKNKCSSSHECQDICVATPGKPGFICVCRDGYSLVKDGKSCEKIQDYKSPLSCNKGEFQCKKFPKCVPERLLCNNIEDCGDGSDEDMSICDKGEGFCGQNSFHCGSGSAICVPIRNLCDGKLDCPNGSDEKVDRCTNSTIACSEFEFQCSLSRRCIPRSWVCDGERDCGSNDDSDEHGSCVYPECSRLQFSCNNTSTSSICIPLDSVCDGIKDCPRSGEDELNCDFHCNRTGKLFCEPDNKCLIKEDICDGKCHCSDASDELHCPNQFPPSCIQLAPLAVHDFACDFDVGFVLSKDECYNVSCGRHSYRCHDGTQCVPLWARCDGKPDCKIDGSDELGCPKPVLHCPFPSRLCDNNTQCIKENQLCDGKFHCQDKTDEGMKCAHVSCEAANCSHLCTKAPEGPLCYCPSDMHLSMRDKSQCVDEHPCDRFGTCSQICRKIGTTQHQCLCLPGYALKDDGITCTSITTESPYLVFSNRHELRGLYLNNTSNFQSLISNLRNSIALDYFYQNGRYDVFWSDVVDDRIYRGSLVGGSLINIEIVIETGLATAEGLAIDWIGENIYWVESNLDQIEVAKLNGSFRETLISGNMVSPRSISVDPNVGLLFWSDWQTEAPRIERASMSGKYRTIVFKVGSNGEGAWPNGLTLDFDLRRVYWVDARLDSIHTIKYDGTDFQTVLSNHAALSHPFSITLFESTLVWTDWRSNSVMKANKFHGGNVTTIHKTYTQPFDVKILHQTRQPRRIKNPCSDNNGNCSHLCLLSVNNTHDCGCPHLMTLGSDNRTCIANEKMLLFSRLNEIRAVYLDKPYYHAAPPISYPLIVAPANLHFVAKFKQVYWSDSQSGETKRANIETHPSIETLIDSAAGKPLAIGVDWISNLIFIALQNPSRNSISVTNLEGQYFTTIIYGKQKQELKNVNSIAVNPYKAELYWPDGNTPNDYMIQMANMDGSKRTVLVKSRDNTHLENPASLSYDFKSDRLYWINFNTQRIQYYDFKDKLVKLISFGDYKPHVITVYGDEIFFASEKQDAILKGDKTLGGKADFVRNNTENIYSIRVYDPEEQHGENSCSINKGGCQHLCLPVSAKKRVCKCALGYMSDEKNPTKCKSVETVLVYSDSSGIKGISPHPEELNDLLVPIPLVSFATDIDVDEGSDQLYWLDNEKGRISRIRRDGTDKKTVLKDLEAVTGLAIDWNAGNMYWANPKDSYIEVAHLNGTSHYVLIRKDLEKPMSLAVDPKQGLLFWTDVIKGRVERSGLDGSNRKVIASNERASDIALDTENQNVYWCDSTYDKIESIKYDGSDRKTVYKGTPGSSHLHSPVIDKGFLYWVDMGHSGGSIMRAPVKNFSAVQPVRQDLGVTIKDLTVFSHGRQTGKNPCGINNGGCGDLCFWNGTHPICVCAHGKIASDNKSCEPYDAFIAYSRVNAIETVHVKDEITPNYPYPPIQSSDHIRNAIGLAYDYSKFILFYSDVQLGTINSVFFNGTNFAVVAEKQGSVEGLYYEASHSDLYWTCSNDASINRINPYIPSAKVEKIIKLTSNDKPRGIAVDPCESRVYWTNWDSNRPSIQRAYLSGYRIESIIITDIRMPNSLALDHAARKLYWVDARLDKIERADLDGSNRKIIARDKPKHAFSISIYKDYIIWSDWVLLSVMRANKYTGEDVQALRKDIPKPMGIVAISPQEDVCQSNPCKFLNGGCSDICSLDEHGKVVCGCSPGKALLGDGRCVAEAKGVKNCTSLEFPCETGGCIFYALSCDGIPHCPDSSDEKDIYCATRQCKEGFFKCVSSNRCIPESSRCNSINECPGDDSDEANCTCSDKQFRCYDGRCIPMEKKCDQHPDCKDISDEKRSECPEVSCPKIQSIPGGGDFYQCRNTTACISPKWECDQSNDCFDNSDEENCPKLIPGRRNESEECQPNSFRCSNGQCILSAWRCDGDADCEDELDESNCEKEVHCGRQQFRCNDGECIAEHWKCDGIEDCNDKSDEPEECIPENCEAETQFRCNSTGRCIPIHFVCDGEQDCRNGEDEEPSRGCENRTLNGGQGCSLTEFACRNGLCLPRNYVCDLDRDCAEGEDELGCQTPTCENGDTQHFKCKNGKCIHSVKKCNGFADCDDNSDEDSSLCQEKYCGGVKDYLCKNGVCVGESMLCNGEDDCGDSTDEIGCGIDECKIDAKLCEHNCIDKKVGYECQCFAGYKPSPDNPSVCEDQNECNERACSQLCKNSIGSYKCSCLPGYNLKEDQHSCKANSSEPLKIMFTNQYYIRMIDGIGDVTLLAHNLTNAVALDYHWDTGCIYWSDVTAIGSSIKRLCSKTNSSSEIGNDLDMMIEQTLHHFTVQSPDGLAIDWVAQNLYWCDKGTNTIEVSKVDGRFRKVLIEGLQDPRAIALDPFRGYLYWSDWGDEPIIGKAGMDGSRTQTLITENLGWPNALTISYETKEIWWADAKEDYVAVADLNGKNRKIVHSRANNPTANIHHIFSLTVFENWIYWSDWETKTVERCHKYSGLNQTTVSKLIHRPMDVKVFHPFRQPPMDSNPCINNGGCQNLCLLTPERGQVCACPENFILSEDGKSCRSNCTSSHFVCKNTSKCIPKWWKCDTQADCDQNDHCISGQCILSGWKCENDVDCSEDEPISCPPFNCTPGYVQFDDGVCLHPSVLCDGKNDTKNGEDEKECDEHTCFSSQFKCQGNGTVPSMCIPSHKRCDGSNDCPLRQDEEDCVPSKCPLNQFQCKTSGKCLQQEWLCDLEDDCGDNSDETNCTIRVCDDPGKFRCRSGKCIPENWKCDGEKDCSEGEDELAEKCEKPVPCDPSYYPCSNSHKCIPSRWRCDFEADCPEGDDESGCVPRECSESEIKCGDGRCIHSRFHCDGEFQCVDQSDELNCNTSCSANEFLCTNPQTCLPASFRCDGDLDCLDGTDEISCDNSTCDGFLCKNGECIRKLWVCDGEKDCVDGDDEVPEVCASRPCEAGQFRCRNNICIPYSATCNWINDCKDESDELPGMCITHRPHSCSLGEFECAFSKKCINESLVCDGYPDCEDTSDELGCQICPFGYCSQLCVVKKQSRASKTTHFSCECSEGYSLSHEGNSSQCVAKGEAAHLVVASEDQLRKLRKPHDNETVDLLLSTSSLPSKIESIDYMIEEDGRIDIFWTSRTSKTIQAIYLPAESNSLHARQRRATSPKDIITGLDEPRGISIDWTTSTIYWVDAGPNTLSVSSLDGKTRMVLINKHISEPHDVVVDPQTGRVYWSDWLDQRIDFALMDGSGRKTVLHSPCPTGLAIDYPARRLYFTDIKSHTIESTTLDGKDRHVVKQFVWGDLKPYKIDVFEDTLFITTYNSNKILKLNKFGKGNVTDISQGIHKTSDLIILQQHKQPHYDNPCKKISCPAPGLCLRNGSATATCLCPNGKSILRSTVGTLKTYECNTTVEAVCDLKCKAGGSCVIDTNGPKCKCNSLYDGARCEKYRCSGYCLNKGLCYPDPIASLNDGEKVPLKCQCPPNYSGERCETKIETCQGLCRNGGKCNNATNVCQCPDFYRGRLCEECEGLRCENGGFCSKDKKGKPTCKCNDGFSGIRCEKPLCSNFCKNKGKCKIKDGAPMCECATGYEGKQCEENVCDSFCHNGGTCDRAAKEVVCNCPKPFTGVTCETNLCETVIPTEINVPDFCKNISVVDVCVDHSCQHGGSCQVIDQQPNCRCPDSWVGLHCEIEASDKKPCQAWCLHSGVCVLQDIGFKRECKCVDGWTGYRCQIRSSCQRVSCFNGGTCIPNLDNSLRATCKCLEGFHGIRCETKDPREKAYTEDDNGITWVLVLVFILVALSVASISGCIAYLVMRRKDGRPFMHMRMQDSGTVEISNPMFLKDEGDDDHVSEPSLIFDSDKVLLQGTNFTNPVYDTMYKEGESSTANDEKKGLLQGDDFSSSGDHPLADPLA